MSKENKKSVSKDISKKFTIELLIELGAAALSTLLYIHFSPDVSVLAFPLALIFTGLSIYFAWFKMLKPQDGNKCYAVLKFVQYMPFVHLLTFILRRAGEKGTPGWYDVITVILWIVMFIDSFVVAYYMNDKRIKVLTAEWKTPKEKYNKPKGSLRLLYELIDWIDALVQAVFIVLIFQIFVIQLYEIPSESMVSTFLIKDRVLVTKLDCGPKFPLTNVGLPDMRKYKKGDTVVLRNPHYSMDRKSEVKTVTSQLVYMLTFMQVNMNKDADGELKADPLVKRVVGEPGEQLVMQDGTLYIRTKDNEEFTPSKMDAKYATWNLNAIKPELKTKVQTFPLSQEQYEKMLQFEDERRNYDLTVADFNARELVIKFNSLAYSDNLSGTFYMKNVNIYDMFGNVDGITRQLMTQEGGVKWFNDFMTSWIPFKNDERDMYAEANYRLNVMSKMIFGNLVVRYAELMRNSVSASQWTSDSVIVENMEAAEEIYWYVQSLLDQRNMPVFPANDSNGNAQYLPANCYFMMGDNRFNSMDLRHASDYSLTALTKDDPKSVEYYSNMAPQYINKKYIIGKPTFRFLPANRVGRVR